MEDYDPSRSPVSYDVMYLPFPYIYGAMFGWDVPSRVDPLLSRHVSLFTRIPLVRGTSWWTSCELRPSISRSIASFHWPASGALAYIAGGIDRPKTRLEDLLPYRK